MTEKRVRARWRSIMLSTGVERTSSKRGLRASAANFPQREPAVIQQPGQSPLRLIGYGILGWVLCAATMGVLLALTSERAAQVLHALGAPAIFAVLARRYFPTRRCQVGIWMPLLFVFAASWGTGELMSMLPGARSARER
jgi:hypothetical protein